MALQHEASAPQQSVQQALRVLDTVTGRGDGVTDSDLAAATGLDAGRLGALLRMLRREGYVEKIQDGAYVTGATLRRLDAERGRARAFRAGVQATLNRLRDTLGAAVYLSRYVDGEVRVTQYAAGPRTPRVHEWVDFRCAAHASAVGKSLLGQLDVNGRHDHLFRHRMPRLTARTITSERALLSRLDAQLPAAPVLDLQEYAVGTVCAAVPVVAGGTAGSLGISLPLARAHRLRAAARTLTTGTAPVLLSLAVQDPGWPRGWS